MSKHEAAITADTEGEISLWCSCDEESAVITYVGDYVPLVALNADRIDHELDAARDVLR